MTSTDGLRRQNVTWQPRAVKPTLVLVEDQQSEFKRSLASNLLVLRLAAGYSNQDALARELTKRGAVVSTATYRRWEDPDQPHIPDAWQVNRLAELLDFEPDELVRPTPLTDREREIARRTARRARRGQRRGLEGD